MSALNLNCIHIYIQSVYKCSYKNYIIVTAPIECKSATFKEL